MLYIAGVSSQAIKKSDWAAALATVAIATLGGPVSTVVATATTLVELGQKAWSAAAPMRKARRRLQQSIEEWALQEGIGRAGNRGISLATEVIAQHGASLQLISSLSFKPERVSRQVIRRAAAEDPYWGSEDHYFVAERAILQTYASLVNLLRDEYPVLLPAIVDLRDATEERLKQLEKGVDALAEMIPKSASTEDLIEHYEKRILDWDASPWLNTPPPSEVERRLTLRNAEGSQKVMTADRALKGAKMLTILGGPGSGKSWLAKRFARESARKAIDALKAGLPISQIEFPVLTTWDRWARTPGGLRSALASSAAASGSGNSPSNSWIDDEMFLHFIISRASRVLVIVDSLDEAASVERQVNRMQELITLSKYGSWRIVVTSRDGAWHQTVRAIPSSNVVRVTTLEPLGFYADALQFVARWFRGDHERAQALVRELEKRPDLARLATIPLFLTFYCLLAQFSPLGSQVLPASRHELFDQLIRRLLQGAWTREGSRVNMETEKCLTILVGWAGRIASSSNTPTGLANWGQTFVQNESIDPHLLDAVNRVAPLVGIGDDGTVVRRFVHRAVLEHLVAVYVSRLPAKRAASILIPHLWFDEDWALAAPLAIAAHNYSDNRKLLRILADRLPASFAQVRVDASRNRARLEVNKIMRRASELRAELDERDEPAPRHVGVEEHTSKAWYSRIHIDSDRWHETSSERSRWEGLPQERDTRQALHKLATAKSSGIVRRAVDILATLELSDDERREVVDGLVDRLSSAAPFAVLDLVEALLQFDPDDEQRQAALEATLLVMQTHRSQRLLIKATEVIPGIVRGSSMQWSACDILIGRLDSTGVGSTFRALVTAILMMAPNATHVHRLQTRLLSTLEVADARDIVHLSSAFVETDPDHSYRRLALRALTTRLDTSRPHLLLSAAEAIGHLHVSPQDAWVTLDVLQGLLGQVDSEVASQLTPYLRSLSSVGDWLTWVEAVPDDI